MIRKEIEAYALMSNQVSFTLEKSFHERDGKTPQQRILTIPKVCADFRPDLSSFQGTNIQL